MTDDCPWFIPTVFFNSDCFNQSHNISSFPFSNLLSRLPTMCVFISKNGNENSPLTISKTCFFVTTLLRTRNKKRHGRTCADDGVGWLMSFDGVATELLNHITNSSLERGATYTAVHLFPSLHRKGGNSRSSNLRMHMLNCHPFTLSECKYVKSPTGNQWWKGWSFCFHTMSSANINCCLIFHQIPIK